MGIIIKPTLSLTAPGSALVCLDTAQFHLLKGLFGVTQLLLGTNFTSGKFLLCIRGKGMNPENFMEDAPVSQHFKDHPRIKQLPEELRGWSSAK